MTFAELLMTQGNAYGIPLSTKGRISNYTHTQCDLSHVKQLEKTHREETHTHTHKLLTVVGLWVVGWWMILFLFFPPFWVFFTFGNDCLSALGNVFIYLSLTADEGKNPH